MMGQPTRAMMIMAHGKYLSLEEARKAKKLDRFAEEHPLVRNDDV